MDYLLEYSVHFTAIAALGVNSAFRERCTVARERKKFLVNNCLRR